MHQPVNDFRENASKNLLLMLAIYVSEYIFQWVKEIAFYF